MSVHIGSFRCTCVLWFSTVVHSLIQTLAGNLFCFMPPFPFYTVLKGTHFHCCSKDPQCSMPVWSAVSQKDYSFLSRDIWDIKWAECEMLMIFTQVIEREKAKTSRPNYARVIADAGIRAAQDPVKILVPVVVALLSLQTITQALQIWVEDEMFRNYHALFSESLQSSAGLRLTTLCLPLRHIHYYSLADWLLCGVFKPCMPKPSGVWMHSICRDTLSRMQGEA